MRPRIARVVAALGGWPRGGTGGPAIAPWVPLGVLGRLAGLLEPAFLLSFSRGSAGQEPAFFSVRPQLGSSSHSARAMPARAPAWPLIAAAVERGVDVVHLSVLVTRSASLRACGASPPGSSPRTGGR
jgi:hypothetical protein